MISPQILAAHYEEYAAQPDEWVSNMHTTKKSIVKYVLETNHYSNPKSALKVVVLGASDKRYIPVHEKIFAELTGKIIHMITFDLDPQHLGGVSKQVVKHDVTRTFPDAPFDIVFSHELMKFLEAEEQYMTLVNSYYALGESGVAMHIIHEPSIKGTPELRSWQNRVNPDELIDRLKGDNIPAIKLEFESDSNVSWLKPTTVIVLKSN